MKKIFISFLLLFHFLFAAYSHSSNDTQVIQAGSWVYEGMYNISTEVKEAFFIENQPMTIGELKYYFNQIEYEKLSEAGKKTYKKVKDILYKNEDFFKEQEFRVFTNLILSPEVYYRSNTSIPYSFDYFVNDRAVIIPIIFGFSNYITIEPDICIGKNYPSMQAASNFTNIPYAGNQFDFNIPKFAYGASGYTGEKWGTNIILAKEGMSIGDSKLGSIVYNKTFETDFYAQLNAFTDRLKYTMNIVQVDNTKYFYTHQINTRIFKNFRFSVVEGSLLNSAFELRYLNPFMFMHSFSSWTQYPMTEAELIYYQESRFCAYMAIMGEWMPFSNFRIYGMYAQNEILDLGGAINDASLSYPDSIGGQLGFEYNFLLQNASYLKVNLEAVYTSPFLYIKQSPNWSLYRARLDVQTNSYVYSWLGSPFGPDCFAIQLYTKYDPVDKWDLSFGYLFKLHGGNSYSSLFDTEKNYNTNLGIWTYYPFTKYMLAQTDGDRIAARNESRNMWMSGIAEHSHSIAIKANYSIFENLNIYSQVVYTFVMNLDHNSGLFAHGIELSLGCKYSILK